MAILNGSGAVIGQVLSDGFQQLPEPVQQGVRYVAQNYEEFAENNYQTTNQRFMFDTAAGTFIGHITSNGLSLAKIKKPSVTQQHESTTSLSDGALQVMLKEKQGAVTGQFDKKINQMQQLAAEGKLVKTNVQNRNNKLTEKYRRRLNKKIKSQYGEVNPVFAEKAKKELKKK